MKNSKTQALEEKRRSQRHFKARVDPEHKAETKSVRRFVDKTFKEKSWHKSGDEIRKRTAITGPVVRAAAKKGFGNYIY